ncbi:hypothetical protein PIB30_093170, partial [Stylosanthes scabra]|nr:hypothetical protein [Stylosanthes scabra]
MVKVYNLFLVLCLVAVVPTSQAEFVENATFVKQIVTGDNKYWNERAEIARKLSEETYFPDPHELAGNFSATVMEDLDGSKHIRRNLNGQRKDGLPCEATNPIDRCWRCDPDWESNRQKL